MVVKRLDSSVGLLGRSVPHQLFNPGKLPNFWVLRFPTLQRGDGNSGYFIGVL